MKILLIEDRIVRKELFVQRSNIDLDQYLFLKQASADEYKDIKSKLKNADTSIFNGIDLIITHKSAFTINEQDILASVGKPIIYFSGGISQSFYSEFPVPCLHINSSDFYGQNLIQFLNHVNITGELELLILEFGANWRLNLLLNTRDKLNQLLYKNSKSDLFPEDFNAIFSSKISSIIFSNVLKEGINDLLKLGLKNNEANRINAIMSELNVEIQNNLKVVL
ncbi:MAG: hypothetical protein FJY17_01105 [Bacteroidetes bacterium]|nr:hypothetical protein [Bacteroidota bacterium]